MARDGERRIEPAGNGEATRLSRRRPARYLGGVASNSAQFPVISWTTRLPTRYAASSDGRYAEYPMSSRLSPERLCAAVAPGHCMQKLDEVQDQGPADVDPA